MALSQKEFNEFFTLAYNTSLRSIGEAREAINAGAPFAAVSALVEASRHAGEAEMLAGMHYGSANRVPTDIHADINRLDATLDKVLGALPEVIYEGRR